MPALRRASDLVSPLALAAYAGWGAVFVQAGNHLASRDPTLGWAARGAMLAYLAGFMHALLFDDVPGVRGGWGLGLMLASALLVLALGPAATSPILMVILAAGLGARLGDRALAFAVAGLVAATGAMLHLRWGMGGSNLWVQLASFASFMAFAAVVLRQYARADALAAQLRETNAGLLSTRSLLGEAARDSERLRLSRELHDVAGHKLTALKLNLAVLAREPQLRDRPEIDAALLLSDELLQDLRALVQQLRRHDGIDLHAAFARLAETLPQPKVHVDVADDARVPGPRQAEALLRVAQEGLTNSARHGGARQAWLSLQLVGGVLALCLDDDGHAQWPLREGNGLTGMRERVEAFHGALDVSRSPRGGVRLCANMPLEPRP
ncbi:sensor histidine kinase [Alkalisalibacterium limincola]|uniref:Sensor histidine kinase n=1 Tax=Alkalisalibacterium limincola TaxID=2699169 RepID=A0A5C8KN44_9GAMM|nr:histidine kinase [Alkalisalibacterium limincola]TXK60718.1 sensor histidine kinase [Alkalisalibacterium limincola]